MPCSKHSHLPQQISSDTARSTGWSHSISHHEHPILNLQRTIGNQGVLRLLKTGPQPDETASRGADVVASHPGFPYNFASIPVFRMAVGGLQRKLTVNAPGDAYDQEADRVSEQVMRMPEAHADLGPESSSGPRVQLVCALGGTCDDCKKEHPEKEHAHVQMKAAGPASTGGIDAPPIVHNVLRSAGRPLDAATRAFMEPRFGHDFSNVRVHTDDQAAESARSVQARAYTVGTDMVFGAREFAPGTEAGQHLLGHELAHIVQQQHAPASNPVLRMKPIPTWSGEFDTEIYSPVKSSRERDLDTYGLGIRLKFRPGTNVDAEKIALVQSAQSLVDTVPQVTYTDPHGVTAKRVTSADQGSPGLGIHIDAWPYERTPVLGMTMSEKGSELSESSLPKVVPAKDDFCSSGTTSFGSRSKGKKPVDAKMCDTPTLPVKDSQAASQHFETTALAVEGTQKGAYYGSVAWGWDKSAGAKVAKILDLQLVSKNIPSVDFARVADLWNMSHTDTGEKTIPLPLGKTQFTNKKETALVDDPDEKKLKSVGPLALNTQVEVIEDARSTKPDWEWVVAIDGTLAGKAGWVKKEMLSDHKTDPDKPGKK